MAVTQRRAAIAGIGQTAFTKSSGRSELQLAVEAVRATLDDAGLRPSDVDGTVTFTMDNNDEFLLMRTLGIPSLCWTSRTIYGGGGACATIQHAAAAVESGAASVVVIYRAFNERSEQRIGQPKVGPAPAVDTWARPFAIDTPAKRVSLMYQRYMHRYGVTNADFGRYSVVARRHTSTNPEAWYYQRPISLNEHQQSRWVVEPVLRLLDCCQETDGGVACVVTTLDRAADLRQPSVVIEATTQGLLSDGNALFAYYPPDVTVEGDSGEVARRLWERTGLKPRDIDAAMIYDHFSPVVFYHLEAYGFCGRGEARDFIAAGNIALDGELPVNTHGGLIGEAYVHGMNNILEGVRQLRGTAANQLDDPHRVVCIAPKSVVLLGKAGSG